MADKRAAGSSDQQGFLGDTTVDRVLGAMFIGIMGLSILSFLVLMIGSFAGWLDGALYSTVMYIPFIGLPLAIVLMITVTVRTARRRAREARESGRR